MTAVTRETRTDMRDAFTDWRNQRTYVVTAYSAWLAAQERLEDVRIAAMRSVPLEERYSPTSNTLAMYDAAHRERVQLTEATLALAAAEADRDLALAAVGRSIVNALLQALQ